MLFRQKCGEMLSTLVTTKPARLDCYAVIIGNIGAMDVRSLTRATRAILACLFVIHSLGLLKVPMALGAYGDASQRPALVHGSFMKCAGDAGENAPLPADHDPSECCALCSGAASDDSFLTAIFLAVVIDFHFPEASSTFLDDVRAGPFPSRHAGWGSSWSAQSPPFA